MIASVPPSLKDARLAPDPLFALWAKATAAAAFLLLFAGGMVTSTGSGLAVPDWPLSYGTLNPPMTGGIFFEHGHRLFAGLVALMTFGLAILSRRPGVGLGARTAARLAAAGVLVQAALGGATVLLLLPPAVSIAHALLGQGVFALLLSCAALSSLWYAGVPRVRSGAVAGGWAWLGLAAYFVQLGLGARLRHGGDGVALHGAGACVVAVLGLAGAWKAWKGPGALRGPALLLAVAVPLQVALGLVAWRLRADPTLSVGFMTSALWRSAHLSGGALLLAGFTLLALGATRASETA